MTTRVAYSDHLVGVLITAEAAATRLSDADPDRRQAVVARARRQSARLSARLDGSPLETSTAEAVDEGKIVARHDLSGVRGGAASVGWAQALRLEGMATQEIAAVEYANLLACFDLEPLITEALFERPLEVLAMLHGAICRGLVAPEVVGRPRRTAQAVHDGSQGRVLYNAAEPEAVPGLLAQLEAWLRGDPGRAPPLAAGSRQLPGVASAGMPAIIVAGVVHECLLAWQPFEAGNGRLARAAARLVLRARGLDPHGAGVAERTLAADSLGYYGEVAATIRRGGDLGLWLERYAEAVAVGLEIAAAQAAPRPLPEPPRRAVEVCAGLPAGGRLSVAEYRARAGVGPETAARELRALVLAGLLAVEPRSRGLRYRRPDSPPTG
jgi:Fic family protein